MFKIYFKCKNSYNSFFGVLTPEKEFKQNSDAQEFSSLEEAIDETKKQITEIKEKNLYFGKKTIYVEKWELNKDENIIFRVMFSESF